MKWYIATFRALTHGGCLLLTTKNMGEYEVNNFSGLIPIKGGFVSWEIKREDGKYKARAAKGEESPLEARDLIYLNIGIYSSYDEAMEAIHNFCRKNS